LKRSLFIIFSLSLNLLFSGAIDAGFASIRSAAPKGKAVTELHQTNIKKDNSSENGAILCGKASAQYEQGRLSKNSQDKYAHFRQAEDFARQAIEANPKGGEGYRWMAIAIGAQADDADIRTQIQLSRRVKENIDKAIALDPNDDISLLVLSRWHYKIASLGFWSRAVVKVVYGGLPPASMKKSEELLLRAITIKDRISHRYCLAKVYNQMGRREDALRQLRLALTLPVTFPEEADDLEKAKRKLVSWK
jgi:tetratricopeptide (TPR) repeat protein